MDITDTQRTNGTRRPRRTRVYVGAAIGVVAIATALALFQPWQLWVDSSVNDAAPTGAVALAPAAPAAPAANSTTPPTSIAAETETTTTPSVVTTVAVAPAPTNFISLDHDTSGQLVLLQAPDGQRYVRFEGLATDNGPDVKVYLSTNPIDGPEQAFDDDIVDLGRLQGNLGDQNYAVPAEVDLSRYRSLVIWCDRFNSAFGAAPLA